MPETVLTTIVGGVIVKLTSLSIQEIGLAWGVKSELIKLKDTVSAISAVLLDAEKQQANSHAVKDWLEKLKDVLYDVDDLLDDFTTEALRVNVETRWKVLKEVCYFFSMSNPLIYRLKIGHKMKDIRQRLDEVAYNRRNFQLSEHVVETRVQVREGTHSFVRLSEVIGRVEDKEKIVKLITSDHMINLSKKKKDHMIHDQSDLHVVPIVGLGGLGKTTLAKLVYNDEKVSQRYEIRLWVCVSEESKLSKVLQKIIKSATGESCEELDLHWLQSTLRNILHAQRFLLVLDDIWNDDPKWWTELRDLLIDDVVGRTVIVTTRSFKVASNVGTVPYYNLSELPLDNCLSLFWKCAFKKKEDRKRHPELMEVGRQIVDKCGGVPLAVKTLGSLLYMKTDVAEWLYIKDSDIWELEQKENDILPALRLSYEQLPFYLKECFAYCSIFPKNYEISRHELINLWIAQGLVRSPGINQEPEDIGNQYFNELMARSFFQDIFQHFDNAVDTFKMHDLVHDLARSVAEAEFSDANMNSKDISDRVRHITFHGDDCKNFPTSLACVKKLRSFTSANDMGRISKHFVDTLVTSFMCLRVLDLSNSNFDVLPRLIGKLKHLRYLDLSWNRSIKMLPNSICNLYNLQTLYLYNCEQLQDLPRDFKKLISLRYLSLTSELISVRDKTVHGMNSLRYLRLRKCTYLESLSEGIRQLIFLRELEISECPSLTTLPSNMECLADLKVLMIEDCPVLNILEDRDLQGLRSLQTLIFSKLPLVASLPLGLLQSAPTLQYLAIYDCSSLRTLPEWLQTLTSLKALFFIDCPNLLSLPQGMHCLTNLHSLNIRGSPYLITRCKKKQGQDSEIDYRSYDEQVEDWAKISHIDDIIYDEGSDNITTFRKYPIKNQQKKPDRYKFKGFKSY